MADILITLFGLAVLVCVWVMLYDSNRFVVKKYTVTDDRIKKPCKTVFLTDLHNKQYGKENHVLLEAIREARPDLILIAGDILTAQPGASMEPALDFLKKLAEEYPEIVEWIAKNDWEAFPYRDASQMLYDLRNRMKEDFPDLPGNPASIAVKAVSGSLEPYCAPAFYLTVPLDATDSNSIYINRSKTPDGLELYTTLAHEGYPGHLYQTVYHNRSALAAGERPARELLWYGGYQEGWAVYVEFRAYDYAAELLTENGQEAAALTARLEAHNRSLQLCLYSLMDIMIHYENASLQQIADLLQQFGVQDADTAKSVYNYIVQSPCNYPKYYLGYLEILSLREEARKLWGADYTDYRFHLFFLDSGPSDFLSLRERLSAYDITAAEDGKP